MSNYIGEDEIRDHRIDEEDRRLQIQEDRNFAISLDHTNLFDPRMIFRKQKNKTGDVEYQQRAV